MSAGGKSRRGVSIALLARPWEAAKESKAMKRSVSLAMTLLLVVPFSPLAGVFIPCCKDHQETVGVWLDSMRELVAKVKTEDEEQFYRKHHRTESLTYLAFLIQSTEEGLNHYGEMIEKGDSAILDMASFKESRDTVLTLRNQAAELATRIKAAKADKEAKVIIEGIVLELKQGGPQG